MSSSTSKPTQWIVVDDTSPEFTYLGSSWFSQEGNTNTYWRTDSGGLLNSNGQPYRGTMHGTRQPASFSFSYTGTQFEIVGTIDPRNDKGGLGWHCFVDGREVLNSIINITKIPLDTNWFLCGDPDKPSGDGTHTFIANISATTEQPFWFDWMRYSPTPGISLENKMIRYERPDPGIMPAFSSEWDMSIGQAVIAGASFQWEFIGTSFAWYGSLNLAKNDTAPPPTSNIQMGTYQLNGGPAQAFYCPIVGPRRANYWNLKYFDTGNLPMAKHKISVVYTGGVYPMIMDFILVQNGTLSELAASAAHNSARRQRILLASVIPAVVLVILAIALAWFIYQRRRKRREQAEVDIDENALSPSPFPLPLEPKVPHVTSPPSHLDVPGLHPSNSMLKPHRYLEETGADRVVGRSEDGRRETFGSTPAGAPPSYREFF